MRKIKENTIYKDHEGLYSDVKAVLLDVFMVEVNREKYPDLKQKYYLEEYKEES